MTSNKKDDRPLDRTDRRILRELQNNSRITNVELSKRVDLSPTPCLERVRRLEEQGFIKGYSAILEPKKLDSKLLVFVEIALERNSPATFKAFAEAITPLHEVLECHLIAGNFDYLIKVRVGDMDEYRKFWGETLLALPSVSDSRTHVVMEEVKETPRVLIRAC